MKPKTHAKKQLFFLEITFVFCFMNSLILQTHAPFHISMKATENELVTRNSGAYLKGGMLLEVCDVL